MATCSVSTPILYLPSSSSGGTSRANSQVASCSLPMRPPSASKWGLSISNTSFSSPKSGFSSLAARARTSEETSTDVTKQLEVLPITDKIPEESSSDVPKQLEVVPVREGKPEESSYDVSEQFDNTFTDLKRKFDAIDKKSTILIYGSAAVLALLVSSAVVDAIDSVPLLPKAMEFVGFCYTVWVGYRYLLFKKNREELLAIIEELKQNITG